MYGHFLSLNCLNCPTHRGGGAGQGRFEEVVVVVIGGGGGLLRHHD